jgi:hypothetical protein
MVAPAEDGISRCKVLLAGVSALILERGYRTPPG